MYIYNLNQDPSDAKPSVSSPGDQLPLRLCEEPKGNKVSLSGERPSQAMGDGSEGPPRGSAQVHQDPSKPRGS